MTATPFFSGLYGIVTLLFCLILTVLSFRKTSYRRIFPFLILITALVILFPAAAQENTEPEIHLGTGDITNPPGSGRWSYVYYGTNPFDSGRPLKYRVLNNFENAFSGSSGPRTMLLDCDSIIHEIYYGDNKKWAGSVMREYLNSTESFRFLSGMTAAEQDAIAVSNEEMSKLTASMDSIEEASNKIQDVISIIDNIAFQTNILSLNAAIEAARAGQAGKGFAVVADEVGNLAKRSQEAAQSTSDLIQMVTEAVDRGKGITDETAAALDRVSGYADETNEMIKEISEASINQSEALEQISIGINQISDVVQTNSSTSEQSAAASIELANEANNLKEIVKPFKLR